MGPVYLTNGISIVGSQMCPIIEKSLKNKTPVDLLVRATFLMSGPQG